MHILLWVATIVLAVLVLLAAFVYFNQSRLVYLPGRELVATPAVLKLEFEEVYVRLNEREKLHGWFIPADTEPRQQKSTVLFLHGNGGNISHRLATIEFLHRLGAAVFIIDYRGYGLSDGKPGEKNSYDDARAAFDWLTVTKEIQPDEITIFGRSLGGAIAVDLAGRVDCRGLIMESSFTSAVDMGRMIYPFLPISWLMRFDYNSLEKINKVNCPVLVTHSPTDEMIPFEMGRRVYQAASEPKEFVEIFGGHNDLVYFTDESYLEAIGIILYGSKRSGENTDK